MDSDELFYLEAGGTFLLVMAGILGHHTWWSCHFERQQPATGPEPPADQKLLCYQPEKPIAENGADKPAAPQTAQTTSTTAPPPAPEPPPKKSPETAPSYCERAWARICSAAKKCGTFANSTRATLSLLVLIGAEIASYLLSPAQFQYQLHGFSRVVGALVVLFVWYFFNNALRKVGSNHIPLEDLTTEEKQLEIKEREVNKTLTELRYPKEKSEAEKANEKKEFDIKTKKLDKELSDLDHSKSPEEKANEEKELKIKTQKLDKELGDLENPLKKQFEEERLQRELERIKLERARIRREIGLRAKEAELESKLADASGDEKKKLEQELDSVRKQIRDLQPRRRDRQNPSDSSGTTD